jgi:effector-binding domain-containing protein
MIDLPQLIDVPAQTVAFIPITVPRDQIQEVMGPGIQEVMSALSAQGIQITGSWFTHHLRMSPEIFDFKICVPIASPVAPVGRVQAGERRRAKVARTIYHGGYEGLGDAWGEFMDWIEAQGLLPADDLWECYTTGPEASDNPADWCTQLNRPLL